jgi:hypothetical protein
MIQWIQIMSTMLARQLKCRCDLLAETAEAVMQWHAKCGIHLVTVVLVTQPQADLMARHTACSMMLSMHCLLYWCIMQLGPSTNIQSNCNLHHM